MDMLRLRISQTLIKTTCYLLGLKETNGHPLRSVYDNMLIIYGLVLTYLYYTTKNVKVKKGLPLFYLQQRYSLFEIL